MLEHEEMTLTGSDYVTMEARKQIGNVQGKQGGTVLKKTRTWLHRKNAQFRINTDRELGQIANPG